MNTIINQLNNSIELLKKGGSIHIKEENKGKFTETKKRTGKTAEELVHSKNPLTRKRAQFEINARSWKHQTGGIIKGQDGIPKLERVFRPGHEVSFYEDMPINESKPYDWDEMKLRQHYNETRFKPNQVSRAGAVGDFQITPITYKQYLKIGGEPGDLNDSKCNEHVRDVYMDWIASLDYWDKDNSDENIYAAKLLGAYNMGPFGFKKQLRDLEAKGYDTKHSTDWINEFNKETRDYMNFSGLSIDGSGDLTMKAFKDSLKRR